MKDNTGCSTQAATPDNTLKKRLIGESVVILVLFLLIWGMTYTFYSLPLLPLLLLLVTVSFIVGWIVIRRFNDKKQQQIHNLQLQSQLSDLQLSIRQHEQQHHSLLHQIVATRDAERQSLARELHDEFGQHLAAVDANLTVAKQLVTDEKTSRMLTAIDESVCHLRTLVRHKLHSLNPPLLHHYPFTIALALFLDDWQLTHPAIEISKQIQLDDNDVSPVTGLTCYRVIQEALVNVVKHAKATQVSITLHKQMQESIPYILLRLRDNGVGIRDSLMPGMGLSSMQERAQALNGQLTVTSQTLEGTCIEMRLPITTEIKVNS